MGKIEKKKLFSHVQKIAFFLQKIHTFQGSLCYRKLPFRTAKDKKGNYTFLRNMLMQIVWLGAQVHQKCICMWQCYITFRGSVLNLFLPVSSEAFPLAPVKYKGKPNSLCAGSCFLLIQTQTSLHLGWYRQAERHRGCPRGVLHKPFPGPGSLRSAQPARLKQRRAHLPKQHHIPLWATTGQTRARERSKFMLKHRGNVIVPQRGC